MHAGISNGRNIDLSKDRGRADLPDDVHFDGFDLVVEATGMG